MQDFIYENDQRNLNMYSFIYKKNHRNWHFGGFDFRGHMIRWDLHNSGDEDTGSGDFNEGRSGGTKKLTRPKTEIKKPSMYKVLLLNDDFTPMDFVVHVIMKFFKKSAPEAHEIMLNVHNKGAGLCGVFPFEIAETKVHKINSYAQKNQHPLKATYEQE